jgi:hypothetical protein
MTSPGAYQPALEVRIFIHHVIPGLLAAPFGGGWLRLNLLKHLKLFVHFRFLKLINNQSRTSHACIGDHLYCYGIA